MCHNITNGTWNRAIPLYHQASASAGGNTDSNNNDNDLYVNVSNNVITFRLIRRVALNNVNLNSSIVIQAYGNTNATVAVNLASGTDSLITTPYGNFLSMKNLQNVEVSIDTFLPVNQFALNNGSECGFRLFSRADGNYTTAGDRWSFGVNSNGVGGNAFSFSPNFGTLNNIVMNPDGSTTILDITDGSGTKSVSNNLMDNSGNATSFTSTSGYNPLTFYSSTVRYGLPNRIGLNVGGWFQNGSGQNLKVIVNINATNNNTNAFQMAISVNTIANVYNSSRVYGKQRSYTDLDTGNQALSTSCVFIMSPLDTFTLYCRNTASMNLNYNVQICVP
jgi:hypothetical protein